MRATGKGVFRFGMVYGFLTINADARVLQYAVLRRFDGVKMDAPIHQITFRGFTGNWQIEPVGCTQSLIGYLTEPLAIGVLYSLVGD